MVSREQRVRFLKDELMVLASMVEQLVAGAIQALQSRNPEDAARVYQYDRQVNRKHLSIEASCLDLIIKDPPILVKDLRLLASLLDVNLEIERIGDQAKGSAKICQEICFEPPLLHSRTWIGSGNTILGAYHLAVGDFVCGNPQSKPETSPQYSHIRVQLADQKDQELKQMTENPPAIQNGIKYFWVCHNLETLLDADTVSGNKYADRGGKKLIKKE